LEQLISPVQTRNYLHIFTMEQGNRKLKAKYSISDARRASRATAAWTVSAMLSRPEGLAHSISDVRRVPIVAAQRTWLQRKSHRQ
jgi:hypothetical protein